jgi:hypothetical protein
MSTHDKLTKLIALGKTRYVVRYGVLGWGLGTAALFTAWTCFSKESIRTVDVVLPVVLFPLGGIVWGSFMWAAMKKKHADATASDSK